MITAACIKLAYLLKIALIAVLPTYAGLPAGLNTALVFFFSKAAAISGFLPMTTIYTIVLLGISIEIGIMVFHWVSWGFHWKQPTSR